MLANLRSKRSTVRICAGAYSSNSSHPTPHPKRSAIYGLGVRLPAAPFGHLALHHERRFGKEASWASR